MRGDYSLRIGAAPAPAPAPAPPPTAGTPNPFDALKQQILQAGVALGTGVSQIKAQAEANIEHTVKVRLAIGVVGVASALGLLIVLSKAADP